jgi:hypothetical protein
MTPHSHCKSKAADTIPLSSHYREHFHAINGLCENGLVSHNGGNDKSWNLKIYVIFVLLLKVNKGRLYNQNSVT